MSKLFKHNFLQAVKRLEGCSSPAYCGKMELIDDMDYRRLVFTCSFNMQGISIVALEDLYVSRISQ